MANTIRTKEIGLYILSLLDAAGLSLKTAALGTLVDYMGVEDIGTLLPAVLVAPVLSESAVRTTNQYTVTDTLRILYVEKFAAGQERVPLMLDRARTIIDALSVDDQYAGALSPGLPAIAFQFVSHIEWEPQENTYPGIVGTPVKTIALTNSVRLVT